MAKKETREQFVLTHPVWAGEKQLKVGTIITFEGDEPTGVYKGRCKPVGEAVSVEAPDTSALDAATARAVAAEGKVSDLEKELDAVKAELAKAKTPPTPPKP